MVLNKKAVVDDPILVDYAFQVMDDNIFRVGFGFG